MYEFRCSKPSVIHMKFKCIVSVRQMSQMPSCPLNYTPKAVVIDNHLPRQPLISSYVPDWPLPPRVYIPSEREMALRARIYAYNRHLSFDVAFICSTLAHCGVCHLSVWRLKWGASYVHQSVWRWEWLFCQSNYVLQQLRLRRTSDTVFRRETDSRRQWGYGTCYGGIVSPLRRSVPLNMIFNNNCSCVFIM